MMLAASSPQFVANFALLSVLSLLLGVPQQALTADQNATAPPKTLPVASHGSWQIVQLPVKWMRKYLKEPRPRQLAIALLAPSAADIGSDNAPCGPAQSVVLIATNDAGRSKSKTLHKGEYCSSNWHPPKGVEWATGPKIVLESIAVSVETNGDIEVTYTVSRETGRSEANESGAGERGSWQETVPVAQIMRLVDAL